MINKINDATTGIVLMFEFEASSLWSFIHHHGYGAEIQEKSKKVSIFLGLFV